MCFTNSQTKYTTLNELRLVTWNVRGVMSSAATLSKLLDQHSKYFMNTVNSMYSNITVCDSNTEVYGKLRCGKGGVSIMCKNTLEFAIRELAEVTDDRIAGVELFTNANTRSMFMFSV